MSPHVRWQVEGSEDVQKRLSQWANKLHNPQPAFQDMMDALAGVQADWFATQGQGTWPQLSEPYRTWKKKKFPKRGILHGPDRPGHRGLQLRDQLTKRPFGFETVTDQGFTFGSTLKYAPYHQRGLGVPVRKPMAPLTPGTVAMLEKILRDHVVGQTIERNMR